MWFKNAQTTYKISAMLWCRAREEAAQWKDRQNQMMKEELRLQSSMTNVRKKEGAAGVSGKERAKVNLVHILYSLYKLYAPCTYCTLLVHL